MLIHRIRLCASTFKNNRSGSVLVAWSEQGRVVDPYRITLKTLNLVVTSTRYLGDRMTVVWLGIRIMYRTGGITSVMSR